MMHVHAAAEARPPRSYLRAPLPTAAGGGMLIPEFRTSERHRGGGIQASTVTSAKACDAARESGPPVPVYCGKSATTKYFYLLSFALGWRARSFRWAP
jgi:hypothetical protein